MGKVQGLNLGFTVQPGGKKQRKCTKAFTLDWKLFLRLQAHAEIQMAASNY